MNSNLSETPPKEEQKRANRKYFIGANWKNNGTTEFVKDYVSSLVNQLNWDTRKLDLMVFPGLLHMSLVRA
jgi:triosephosphate isomerase